MLTQGITKVGNAYSTSLKTNPLRTKMLTSACLFSMGDYLCQKAEQKCKPAPTLSTTTTTMAPEWDSGRTARQGLIGSVMLSPGLHFFLTRVMTKCVLPGRSQAANIALRVGVHQACMMPFIQFTLLFTSGMLQPANTLSERYECGK